MCSVIAALSKGVWTFSHNLITDTSSSKLCTSLPSTSLQHSFPNRTCIEHAKQKLGVGSLMKFRPSSSCVRRDVDLSYPVSGCVM